MSKIRSAHRSGEMREENSEGADRKAPLIQLDADFGADGAFGHRTLEVTETLVRVFEVGGAASFQIPIQEIHSARNEPLVGGGRLEITTKSGEILPIISYSMTVAAKFSEAARGIE